MRKLKKPFLIVVFTVTIIAVLIIIFISPITKYAIEKYDEKYAGRKITLDWAYVNPFTGYIHFSNLKIFELNNDSIFFSTDGISVNMAMLKLFSKTYEISELVLDRPLGVVIHNKKDFNFNDLIEKFSSKGTVDSTKAPVHFNILDIKITDGEFYYHEEVTPINYFIKNVNIQSTGKRWDNDTVATKFSFGSGIGSGDIKGDVTVNIKNKDYRIAVVVTKFNLNIIEQYLNDLTNYGSFKAFLDADVKGNGNFGNVEAITASGLIAISDFHFGKNPKEDFVSFDKLVLAIKELSPVVNKKFFYDSIILNKPYFKYEKYDYLDNLQTMFGKGGENIDAARADSTKFNLIIEIAENIKLIAKNFFKSHYKVDKFAIREGNIMYNDFSTTEKFSIALVPLNISSDSIDKDHSRVNVGLTSGIHPYGNASVSLSINPKDSSDFDLNYHLQKIPAAMFNPYIISQTSFPFDRGTIELKGAWNVRNSIIRSNNHILIIDPRVTKRVKNKDTRWLPMRLLMALVRERGNVIDYQVPITGSLNDPTFHLRDIIVDALANIFVKPATTSYRMQVKSVETEIEKSLTLKWEMRNSLLSNKQEKFVGRMADFLAENPYASIAITPLNYSLKEKEYILFFEAKKKYFLITNRVSLESLSDMDLEKIDKMSVKDPLFVAYLNDHVNDSMLFTIQDKCSRFISPSIISSKYEELNSERASGFISYFKKAEVERRVKILQGESVIPYNGFSFYKISYKGEFPESLIEAYREMSQLDNEAPRKKFKRERKKNKGDL